MHKPTLSVRFCIYLIVGSSKTSGQGKFSEAHVERMNTIGLNFILNNSKKCRDFDEFNKWFTQKNQFKMKSNNFIIGLILLRNSIYLFSTLIVIFLPTSRLRAQWNPSTDTRIPITLNLSTFGANPDDNIDDSWAILKASMYIQNKWDINGVPLTSGLNIDYSTHYCILEIPYGTNGIYKVGKQIPLHNGNIGGIDYGLACSDNVTNNPNFPILKYSDIFTGVPASNVEGLTVPITTIPGCSTYVTKYAVSTGLFTFDNSSINNVNAKVNGIYFKGLLSSSGDKPKFVYNDNLVIGWADGLMNDVNATGGQNLDFYTSEPSMFHFYQVERIKISDVEVNGNNTKKFYKGINILDGFQIASCGILAANSKKISVENVYLHNMGLDGILLMDYDLNTQTEFEGDHIVCEYNRRQGFSITGGQQVTVNGTSGQKSKFNFTGQAISLVQPGSQISSDPGAGVDIEPNKNIPTEFSYCKNIYFNNCEFIGNSGTAVDNDCLGCSANQIALTNNVNFTDCDFWDGDSYGLWCYGEKFTFTGCDIWCTVVHGYGSITYTPGFETIYNQCNFEDKPNPYNNTQPMWTGNSYLYECDGDSKNLTFNTCNFKVNDYNRTFGWFHSNDFGSNNFGDFTKMNNCTFEFNNNHSASASPTRIWGVVFDGNNVLKSTILDPLAHTFITQHAIYRGSADPCSPNSFTLNGDVIHEAAPYMAPSLRMGLNAFNNFTFDGHFEYRLEDKSMLFLGSDVSYKTVVGGNSKLKISQNATLFSLGWGDIDNYGKVLFQPNSNLCIGASYINKISPSAELYIDQSTNLGLNPLYSYGYACANGSIPILGSSIPPHCVLGSNIGIPPALVCSSNYSNLFSSNNGIYLYYSTTQPICFGGVGNISAQASGSVSPYSYSINGSTFQATGNFTGLVAGNYTVTIKDANNCIAITTITLTDPPALTWTSVQPTNPLCAATSSGSINVSAGGGTGTIAYTINSSSGQFTGLGAGNYVVTATDANSCTLTTTITLTDPPALIWSSIQATNPSCTPGSDGEIIVNTTGGSGPVTITPIVLSSLNAATYTIAATDANGCSLSTSVTLYQPISNHCCSTNSNPNAGSNIALLPNMILLPNTQVSTLNASALLANYGSGSIIQGKKFYVDGTLIIDADITLDACDFWFTPFSQIIVQGGHTFNLVNTNLSASCDWWVGIEVQQIQNKVSSTGGSINGAIVGIHASQDAILELDGTTWNEIGQAGIIFANMNSTSYSGYVKNCTFHSTGLQPNSINTQHGILLRDVVHLNLGSTNAGNHFSGLRCGISMSNSTAINSTIGLFDNTFENIHAPLYPTNLSSQQQEIVNRTYLDDQGTAIFANFNINQNAILQTNSLFVDHLGTPTPNMIQCDRGIVTIGGHTSVKNQDMPDVLLGIMCYSPFSRQYDIKNNKIENAHMGIQVAGQPKSDWIIDNNVSLTQLVLKQVGPVAIVPPVGIHTQQQGQPQSSFGNFLHRIDNNTINLHTITGVGIRKQYGDMRSEMSMNTTHLLTTSSATPNSHVIRTLIGYWSDACIESSVIDNVTAGFGNFSIYQHRNAYGVFIDNSPFCKWQCNSANGTRFGFYVWGNNETKKDAVKFNHQNGNEFPWYFLDGSATQYGTLGNIGDPGSTGNEPANEFVGNLAWIGALNINPNTNWKVFRASTVSIPHQIATNNSFLTQSESGALIFIAAYPQISNANFFTENCQNPNSGTLNLQEADEEEFVEYIQAVVADSIQYINYDEVGSWINQYRAYTTLDIDSALRYSENGLLNFYTARQNMNIGRLRETDRLIEILFDSTTDVGNFNTRYQAALAANNQINSGEEWELNEKRMNEALIYSSAIPIDSLEQSLKDDIATLAHTCPFVAGQAVYKARRIWSFWQPNALFDDRVLCLQTENKNGEGDIEDIDEYYNQQIHHLQDVVTGTFGNQKEKEIQKSFEATRIYPNPVSSIINIDLGKKMEADFVLYNSYGEEVVKIKLKNAKSTYNLSHLIPGLYHYRIQYFNGENESGKFTKL